MSVGTLALGIVIGMMLATLGIVLFFAWGMGDDW